MTLSSLSLAEAARSHPDSLALIIEGDKYTFAELDSLAETSRESLRKRSEARALCALLCEPSLEAILQLYACLELGIPLLLLHPRWKAKMREELVDTAEHARFSSLPKGESCVLVCTSGSAAKPKIVVLSHSAICASARASVNNLPWREADRWLLSLPFAHVGGLSILTRCLLGRKVVVVEPLQPRNKGYFERLQELRVSILSLVPTQLSDWVRLSPAPLPRLRAVLVGGAPCSSDLRRKALLQKIPLLCTYGMTEMCSQVATQSLDDLIDEKGQYDVGYPLPGVEIRITQEGELTLRGPQLMSLYVGAPPEEALCDSWFSTGDRASLTHEGKLVIHGRTDNLIISGGENISPEWVENELATLPGVSRLCIVGLLDERWGQRVVAAVICNSTRTEPELWKEIATARLPAYARPKQYVRLDRFPLQGIGKVNRPEVTRLVEQRCQPDNELSTTLDRSAEKA